MAREYFNTYHSYLKSIEPLNDAERGRLFTALLIYSSTGTEPELRGNERFVFPMMKEQIDRDAKRYADKCRQQSEKAQKRWMPRDATACHGMPWDATACQEKGKEKEKSAPSSPLSSPLPSSPDPINYPPYNPPNTPAKEKREKEKETPPTCVLTNTAPQGAKFQPPTVEQVSDYCRERGNGIDPQAFVDFYTSKGWMVGKNRMKDWKAAVRTWERTGHNRPSLQSTKQTAQDRLSASYDRFARWAEEGEDDA